MGFSLCNPSLHTCKQFFKLFNNITNHTAIIVNSYGLHVKCSNKKFKIDSILDEINFKEYTCEREYILAISIKQINSILHKYDNKDNKDNPVPIRIIYSDQPSLLFIINNNSTYSIPCSIINNVPYIKRLHTLDDIDYHVEFEIPPKEFYRIIKQMKQISMSTHTSIINIHTQSDQQHIYINDILLIPNANIDIYRFITNVNEYYSLEYINQIVKNSIKFSIQTLLFGVYTNKDMKILAYLDDYNYIEYYISPLKTS